MDFLQFIPSQDMRKHLKNIAYEFTPLECAWLVYQSKTALLIDRHAAWQEIIDTMPDCEVDFNDLPYHRLHDCLGYLIKSEKCLLEKFFETNKQSIYHYSWIDGRGYGYGKTFFQSPNDCFTDLFSEINKDRIESIWITKQECSGSRRRTYVKYSKDRQIISLNSDIFSDKYFAIIDRIFERMHFVFPTPFKAGDVLFDISNLDFNHNLMIFDKMDFSNNGRHYAYGYVLDDGLIMRDGLNYLNLGYYKGNRLPSKFRALESMREYLTGRLSITGLMNKYHQALCYATAEKVSTHIKMWEE